MYDVRLMSLSIRLPHSLSSPFTIDFGLLQMDSSRRSTGNRQRQKQSANTMDPQADAEFWPLSGKPYFCEVIGKSQHGLRSQLAIPLEVSEKLPTSTVRANIVYRGRVWDLVYHGDQAKRRFGNEGWGKFVTDNNLVGGDVCVFELMEGSLKSSMVKFKVQILRSKFPSELLEKADGRNRNNPIAID